MAVNNALNISDTGIITHDGAGAFSGSTVTEGGVLLAGASNAVTDTGVLTKGTVLVGDGAGAPTELPVGSNGQVLTAASGEASGVEWAAVSGVSGPWVLLSTATASASASLDFDSSIDSTYNLYVFILDGLYAASAVQELRLRTSTDGGSTYDSGGSDYKYGGLAVDQAGSQTSVNSSSAGQIQLSAGSNFGTATTETASGLVWLYNPSGTGYTYFNYQLSMIDDGTLYQGISGGGVRVSAADVDAVQFSMTSGNLTAGSIRMYGVSNPS